MQFVHSPYLNYTNGNSNAPPSSQPNNATPNGFQYTLDQQHLNFPGMQQGFPPEHYGGHPQSAVAGASMPLSSGSANHPTKPKRKQVKNACVNCQKACKKCADARPCPRCIKYGLTETCVDSVRKERKRGVKRGPYKRKTQGTPSSGSEPVTPVPATLASPAGHGSLSLLNHTNPYMRSFESYPQQPTHGGLPSHYGIPAHLQHLYSTNAYQSAPSGPPPPAASVKTETAAAATTKLCSAVLDHSDKPKEGQDHTAADASLRTSSPPATQQQNHGSASTPHKEATEGGSNSGYPATTTSAMYTTPSQAHQHAHQPVWPLPPLQSTTPPSRMYYSPQQQQYTLPNQHNGNHPNQWNPSPSQW